MTFELNNTRIVRVEIDVDVDAGGRDKKYHGRLSLDTGFTVVSANNRYGKSAVFAAITWCLGVEHIYGVSASNNSIFPEAVRTQLLSSENVQQKVIASLSVLTLQRQDGSRLNLIRSVVGGDPATIRFTTEDQTILLKVGHGSARDEVAGFQYHLRTWLGLPLHELVTRQGRLAPIYMENVAPLFLIEQLGGWPSIQSEQIYKYGIHEINQGAVETILGLWGRLERRKERQLREADESRLLFELKMLQGQLLAILNREGWNPKLPSATGSLPKAANRWKNFNIHSYVEEALGFQLQSSLDELAVRRKQALDSPQQESAESAPSAELVQDLLNTKRQHGQAQKRLRELRSQRLEHLRLLESATAELSSAKDLIDLKEGVGQPKNPECPTCRQHVDLETFALFDQNGEMIQSRVDALGQQRMFLRGSIKKIDDEIIALIANLRALTQELLSLDRAASDAGESSTKSHAYTIQVAQQIASVTEETRRTHALHTSLLEWQSSFDDWANAASAIKGSEGTKKKPPELAMFESMFRRNIVKLGTAGITEEDEGDIRIGNDYSPLFRGKEIPAYGSASDRARLVLSYVTALLWAGAGHPGFLVMDEPLQQNPDKDHIDRFIAYTSHLSKMTQETSRQVIIFTSLEEKYITKLGQQNVSVVSFSGKFLKAKGPDPETAKG